MPSPISSSIPQARTAVSVKVLSPNRVRGVPPSLFLSPDIKGKAYSDTPCFAYLIEHRGLNGKLDRLLFDLGIRKDVENSVLAGELTLV